MYKRQVSGRILAENGADERIEPASITKIMTGYVAADQAAKGFISLNDEVFISENCWRKGGSKMFIREGTKVLFSDLMKGMVIQSGNDASHVRFKRRFNRSVLINGYCPYRYRRIGFPFPFFA